MDTQKQVKAIHESELEVILLIHKLLLSNEFPQLTLEAAKLILLHYDRTQYYNRYNSEALIDLAHETEFLQDLINGKIEA